MEKKESIELLNQKFRELDTLKNQQNYQELKVWMYTVKVLIEKHFDQDDVTLFTSVQDKYFIEDTFGDSLLQETEYSSKVNDFRIALKSIIKKHEMLKKEDNISISKAPQDVFQLVSPKAFISHGKESVALNKLREFVETLGIEPILVKTQPNLDKDVSEKVKFYLDQADFTIILATADDKVGDKFQPRQNIIHEIGLAQKTLPGRIIYLIEEEAYFPSNIKPKVYERFKQRHMINAFLRIIRELRAYGILTVTKYLSKETTP